MEVLCQSSLNNCSRHDVWISGVVNYRLLCITGVVMMFAMLVFVRGDRGVLLVPTRNSCSDHAMTAPTHSPSWNSYSRLSMDSGSLRVLFVGDRKSGSSATFHERFLSLATCIARAD